MKMAFIKININDMHTFEEEFLFVVPPGTIGVKPHFPTRYECLL
jgi:hypothetical protein